MSFNPFKILKSVLISEADTLTPKQIEITPGGTASTKTTLVSSQTANRTITLPDSTNTLSTLNGTETFTNKTIDGDVNTLQDIGISSLKTVLGDANKVILHDASGVVTSRTLLNVNVDAAAAIAYSKLNLANSIVNADVAPAAGIITSKLSAAQPSRAIVSDGSSVLTESTTTATEIGYVSGVTSAIQTQINAITGTTVPSGSLFMYAGPTAPGGYQFCYGQAISRTTYSLLFTAIGVTFGPGNGTTTFNLPDLRGRVAAGKDDMGGVAVNRLTTASSGVDGVTLGASGGAQIVALTTVEMPIHTHVQDAHNHTQNSHNHTQNAHTHTITDPGHEHLLQSTQNGITGGSNSLGPGSGPNATSTSIAVNNTTGITNQNTTATNIATTATNQSTTATNQSAGGGSAHNNVQPTLILNYIIKE